MMSGRLNFGHYRAAFERVFTDPMIVGKVDQGEAVPAGRLGRPEEMAWAAAFLCSERAGYVTGTALAVDGGALHAI